MMTINKNAELSNESETKKAIQTKELFEKGNYAKINKKKLHKEELANKNIDLMNGKSNTQPKKAKLSTRIIVGVLITALVGSSLLTSLAMFF